MPKLIIGLVGQSGSGKGTVAEILREKYGAAVFSFGGLLGDLLDQLAVPRTRENLVKLSEIVRHAFGESTLAYALERAAVGAETDIVAIEGIRRLDDIVALEPLPYFKLASITTQPEIRFQRMKQRGEKAGERDMTWEQFIEQSKLPTELTIAAVEARATYKLDNSGSLEELHAEIDRLMEQFGIRV